MDKKKKKTRTMTYAPGDQLMDEVIEFCERSGIQRSEFNRRAARSFLDDGASDGIEVMNLVLLSRSIEELKGKIDDDVFINIQSYLDNIMILKGGK